MNEVEMQDEVGKHPIGSCDWTDLPAFRNPDTGEYVHAFTVQEKVLLGEDGLARLFSMGREHRIDVDAAEFDEQDLEDSAVVVCYDVNADRWSLVPELEFAGTYLPTRPS